MLDSVILSDLIYNEPPVINQSELPNDVSVFNNLDIMLIIGLLLFSIVYQLSIIWSMNKSRIDQDKFTILSVVNLIIMSSLFMLIAGFSSERTTPLIALLGTIVGYVLGGNKK